MNTINHSEKKIDVTHEAYVAITILDIACLKLQMTDGTPSSQCLTGSMRCTDITLT